MEGNKLEKYLHFDASRYLNKATMIIIAFLFILLGGSLITSYALGTNENPEPEQDLFIEDISVSTECSVTEETSVCTEPVATVCETETVNELSVVSSDESNTEGVFKYHLITPSELQVKEKIENPEPTEATEPPSPIVLEANSGSRYSGICLTQDDMDLLVNIIWLEARGEPVSGQQAVAEVVFNRMISRDYFPDELYEVIYDENIAVQFPTAHLLDMAEPTEGQRKSITRLIECALNGSYIIPIEVVFFGVEPENENIWGKIGNHVFCYPWFWDN